MWFGGKLYDIYGSYIYVWWVGVVVGVFLVIVYLLICENCFKIVVV